MNATTLTPEEHAQVSQLFEQVMALSPDERQRFVNASAQMPKYNIPSRQIGTPSSTNVYNGGTTLATVNVYDSGNAKATAYEVANILNNMASRTNHKAGVRV